MYAAVSFEDNSKRVSDLVIISVWNHHISYTEFEERDCGMIRTLNIAI